MIRTGCGCCAFSTLCEDLFFGRFVAVEGRRLAPVGMVVWIADNNNQGSFELGDGTGFLPTGLVAKVFCRCRCDE